MELQASELACVRGERELFSQVDVGVGPGDALRVAGTNGSGKTSLLRMLCGLSSPAHGIVRWGGQDIRRCREQFGSALVYLGHGNGVKDDLAAWENVVVAATLGGRHASRDEAYAALDRQGLDHVADLPTRSLSQGQRKRVALARLHLASSAPLWILDEAFTALDTAAVADLCATLDGHLDGGGMVVYTTHQDVTLAARHHGILDLARRTPC
jgi:heme exporter protein A